MYPLPKYAKDRIAGGFIIMAIAAILAVVIMTGNLIGGLIFQRTIRAVNVGWAGIVLGIIFLLVAILRG